MSVPVEAGHWRLDPARSTVALASKTFWGLMTVKGVFSAVAGEGDVAADGTVRGSVRVEAASIDTKHKKRDEHLRSADFFEVEKHPLIEYTVRSTAAKGTNTAEVTGDLTVRGVSKPVKLSVQVTPEGADAVTLTTEVDIVREDFGITWNQMGMMKGAARITATLRFVRG